MNSIINSKFESCPFMLSLPEVRVLNGEISIKFKIYYNKVCISTNRKHIPIVALESILIQDKFNNQYKLCPEHLYLKGELGGKQVSLQQDIQGKHLLLHGASVHICLLGENRFKYDIYYLIESFNGITLQKVLQEAMTDEDHDRYLDITSDMNSSVGIEHISSIEYYADQTKINASEYMVPSLRTYRDAVYREMNYLKNSGGRKYKATNGVCISSIHGAFAYSFELESELYLSDDAPITLSAVNVNTTGNVLICEGFQIIVVVNQDLGLHVAQAFISVEPWKLLEALNYKLGQLTQDDSIALELLNRGPKLASSTPGGNITTGQEAARRRSLSSDITVIWGPPGTGKTYTMASIAIEALQKGKSVLAVSHSNISVDGVISEIASQLRKSGQTEYLKKGRVLRYGYVRDNNLSTDREVVAFNYALDHTPDVKLQMDNFLREKDRFRNTSGIDSRRMLEIEEKLKKLRLQIRSAEKEYVSRARIVGTTISKVTIDPIFDNKKYDLVMFDEVSMAYVPQIVCAAAYARDHFVAVGDFRQLSPIAQSDSKEILSRDIFSYLKINRGPGMIYNHPWLIMLDEQRRMYPDISAFPNRYVYGNLLKNYYDVAKKRKAIVNEAPFSGQSMSLIDLSGTYCAAYKNSDNSRFNILGAVISFATALSAEKNGEKSIGIITPYVAQTRLIRAILQDNCEKKKEESISCSTVHQFQGSERNIIIFDAVESFPSAKPGWLMSKNDNENVTRLINVAVTRARGKFITVADKRFWTNKLEDPHNIFYKLIGYLSNNCNVISHNNHSLEDYLASLNTGNNINLFQSTGKAFESLRKDISQAKEKIVMSIPDGSLNNEIEGNLYRALETAKKNGIHLLSKSNDYDSLPEKWKRITNKSDNTVIPLLAIDNTTIWYGMPASKGTFHDGLHGFVTVCHIYIRITGQHTIEMIRSLTDLDNCAVNGMKSSLNEKSDNSEGYGKSKGLGYFVSQVEKCPRCKSPMMLTKGRSGKCFLKCPSCGNMEYLTKDLVNWYINHENITCPIHHCEICAGLSKYGIYVKCERGHFLKPDEI